MFTLQAFVAAKYSTTTVEVTERWLTMQQLNRPMKKWWVTQSQDHYADFCAARCCGCKEK